MQGKVIKQLMFILSHGTRLLSEFVVDPHDLVFVGGPVRPTDTRALCRARLGREAHGVAVAWRVVQIITGSFLVNVGIAVPFRFFNRKTFREKCINISAF